MPATGTTEQLDELLGLGIAAIDIPDRVYARAMDRYRNVGDWLAGWWTEGRSGGRIYTQGSVRIGTMVAPIDSSGDYDVDLVYERNLAKDSISQLDLKTQVGDGLAAYVEAGPDGLPRLREGTRCWTLRYPHEPFHMDVLPALPNVDPGAWTNAIWLTDRDLRKWQPSDPIDYALWFEEQMEEAMLELKDAVAKRMDVEDAPPSELKTTLQRAVQALKRHRDIFFFNEEDNRAASIIITTLAAQAYEPGDSFYEVLTQVTAEMPELVERRADKFWIPNPVNPDENFADRWESRPERASAFFRWMEQARADFASYGKQLGVHHVLSKISESLGEVPAKKAGDQWGAELKSKRTSGRLAVGPTGLLSTAGTTVPDHTFHGDVPPAPRRS